MLAIAYGVAEGAEVVATDVHAGDRFVYPGCRPEFIEAFDEMQKRAVEGFGNYSLRLYVSFAEQSKANIVRTGTRLGVPYADTWSCYEGGDVHCGKCGTDVERKQAFREVGVPDGVRGSRLRPEPLSKGGPTTAQGSSLKSGFGVAESCTVQGFRWEH